MGYQNNRRNSYNVKRSLHFQRVSSISCIEVIANLHSDAITVTASFRGERVQLGGDPQELRTTYFVHHILAERGYYDRLT